MNLLNITIFISAALEIILGGFVLLNDPKNKVNQLFSVVSVITAFWITSNSLIILEPNEFWVKNAYATGIILAPTILLWINRFINKTTLSFPVFFALFTALIIYIISIFSNLIISNVEASFTGGFNGNFGPFFFLYAIHFIGVSIYILYLVFKAFHNSQGLEKIQYKYIATGLFGFGLFVGTVNFILPIFGITSLIPLDSASSIIFITCMSLAILRHHLFNIKVIAVELITFLLWIFLLVRTVVADTSQDMWIDGSLFVVSLVLGIMLIKSVINEVQQRQQIEKLMGEVKVSYAKVKDTNDNLAEQIAEQTKDVRRAYEVEKEARAKLEELNKTKDQFITSTQHHLRTPMTSLKWSLESIRSGGGGIVTPELKQILDTADSSMTQMSETIENFIDITQQK